MSYDLHAMATGTYPAFIKIRKGEIRGGGREGEERRKGGKRRGG